MRSGASLTVVTKIEKIAKNFNVFSISQTLLGANDQTTDKRQFFS